MNKLKTIVACPDCGKPIDFSHVKKAILHRLDEEFDEVLKKI